MKIKIYMESLAESHIIYLNDKKRDHILVDTKKSSFDVDRFVFLVADMSSHWPSLLEDNSIIDGLTYRVVIKDEIKDKEFIFRNKFPANIYKLSNLVTEICEEFKNDKQIDETLTSRWDWVHEEFGRQVRIEIKRALKAKK